MGCCVLGQTTGTSKRLFNDGSYFDLSGELSIVKFKYSQKCMKFLSMDVKTERRFRYRSDRCTYIRLQAVTTDSLEHMFPH